MFKKVLLRSSVILGVLSMPMMAESLKGRVFEDTNKNGIYDKDTDLRLKDVNVTVTDAQGTIVTVKTNVNGVYKVEGISTGEALIAVNEATLPGINPVQVVGINPSTKNVRAGKVNWSGKDGYNFASTVGAVCGYVFFEERVVRRDPIANGGTKTVTYNRTMPLSNIGINVTAKVQPVDNNGNYIPYSIGTLQTVSIARTDSNGYYCAENVPTRWSVGVEAILADAYQELGVEEGFLYLDIQHNNTQMEVPFINKKNTVNSLVVRLHENS